MSFNRINTVVSRNTFISQTDFNPRNTIGKQLRYGEAGIRFRWGMSGNGVNVAGMGGTGLLSQISSGINKGIAKGINMIPNSDDTGRPAFPGERHALLKLKNGKFGIGNYIGPNTQIMKRLNRGDPPRTLTDKVAQVHDIRYSLSTSARDIRNADEKMVKKIKQIELNRTDSRFNTTQGKKLIQAKMKLEDKGLLSAKRFSKMKGASPSDKPILEAKLKELEQQGYGKRKKLPPGLKLKRKLLNQKKKKRQPGNSLSKSEMDMIMLASRKAAPYIKKYLDHRRKKK
jgi:hypothetical protein